MVRNLRGIASKEGITIDDESLHVIARKADGAMRDALTLFDQTIAFCGTDVKYADVIKNLGVLDDEYSFSLVDAFLQGDYGTALRTFDEILSKGLGGLHFVSSLSAHFRNLLVSRCGGLDPLLELPESTRKRYAEQAARCSVGFLYSALEAAQLCESQYKAAVSPRLHVEFLLMKLSFLVRRPGIEAAAPAPVQQAAPAPVQQVTPAPQAPVQQAAPAPVQQATPAAESQPAPAADSAPAPEAPAPEAAPAPRTRRRTAGKSGASLSLSSLREEKTTAPVAADATAADDALPEDEVLLAAWKELPGSQAGQPRLASMLQNAQVEISAADGVKVALFRVDNVSQMQWIREKKLRELEGFLQRRSGSSKVRLEVDVRPTEDKPVAPYTDHEKATALMERSGEVQHLIRDFGLETK